MRGRQILTISQNIYCLAPLLARSTSARDLNRHDIGHPNQKDPILRFEGGDRRTVGLSKSSGEEIFQVSIVIKVVLELRGDRLAITEIKLNLHFSPPFKGEAQS